MPFSTSDPALRARYARTRLFVALALMAAVAIASSLIAASRGALA